MKNLLPQGMIQKVVFALLFIAGAMFYAQDKTYASSQSNQIYGACVLCHVADPQNAVGSNETDYAAIKMPVSLGGRIEQTLIFPAATAKHFKKIVIGIGTDKNALHLNLFDGVYVETFLGNVSNNDYKKVNDSMMKITPNSPIGTIQFVPKKRFDRVKLYFNSGIGLFNEHRIYYAYHTPDKFTDCGNPPLDPLAYYSFDGNTNDIISDLNLISDGTYDFIQDDMACGKSCYGVQKSGGLSYDTPDWQELNARMKTIAFWIKEDDTSGEPLTTPRLVIYTNMITIETLNDSSKPNLISAKLNLSLGSPVTDSIKFNELVHFAIVYNEQQKMLCIYKNGKITDTFHSCQANKGQASRPEKLLIYAKLAKIDELLIYDRALTSDEVQALACSYGKLPNCTSGNTAPATTIVSTDNFIVSPNPTTGTLSLDGNIPVIDSDVTIRNTSGTEVYRTTLKSKTFDLPAHLPGGIYILTLQTKEQKIYTRKIILTR